MNAPLTTGIAEYIPIQTLLSTSSRSLKRSVRKRDTSDASERVRRTPAHNPARSTKSSIVESPGGAEICTLPLVVSITNGESAAMTLIDDVLNVLDRIPIWKRLQEVPAEMDDLKARVSELEEKLGGKWPGDVCPFCGARAFRLERADKHGQREIWHCEECGKKREVRHDINARNHSRWIRMPSGSCR